MKRSLILLTGIIFLLSCTQEQQENIRGGEVYSGPIRLHPDNPHYFQYKGEPLLLITSAEHYGALLNQSFDYEKYLETLGREGMNYTRIFAGTYAEIPGESFAIQDNTLAPEPGDFLTPWAYTIPDDEQKRIYNLNEWNDAYFERLHDLFRIASQNDIIIELTFFTSIYRDEHWDISPQNPENNVNIQESLDRRLAHTMDNGELFGFQEKLVRKLVRELNGYDNFFFEIQNEPWADRNVPVYNIVNKEALDEGDWTYKVDMADEASLAWQDTIASIITDEESGLEKEHLIAQNYCNYKAPLANISDRISILNFHYAWPEAVDWNYSFDRVIGFDESGFAGSGEKVYRRQAWRFILSGGGLFNNLDYSFYSGYEDGSLKSKAPGGGSTLLRKQLAVLSEFIHGFDVVKLSPDHRSVIHAPGMIPYVLSEKGQAYAIFLQAINVEESELKLDIPSGDYNISWVNPLNGEILQEENISTEKSSLEIDIEFVEGEIALKVERR